MPIDVHVLRNLEGLRNGTGVSNLIRSRKCSTAQFLNEIYQAVDDVLPGLIPGERYTTELLIGPDLWSRYSIGTRRAAGICLVKLVQNRCLPLVLVDRRRRYPRLFTMPAQAKN
jgi:hypothetical protein